MNDRPKISYIIPIYNVEDYLRECLEVLYKQKSDEVEFVCINDGSTDGCLDILNEYQQKDSRFKVFSQENQGVSSARNLGLKMAQGEWIGWCDPDDYCSDDAIDTLLELIKTTNSDIIKFSSYYVNKDKQTEQRGIPHCCVLSAETIRALHLYNAYEIYGPCVTDKLFRRQFILENNIYCPESRVGEDYCFAALSYMLAKEITFSDKKLYYYRYRAGSLTQDKKIDNTSYINNIDYIKNYLINNNLMDKNVEFYNSFLMIAGIGLVAWLPTTKEGKKAKKQSAKILKAYFMNKKLWRPFTKLVQIYANYPVYKNIFEKLFSVKKLGEGKKFDKRVLITILGLKFSYKYKQASG